MMTKSLQIVKDFLFLHMPQPVIVFLSLKLFYLKLRKARRCHNGVTNIYKLDYHEKS